MSRPNLSNATSSTDLETARTRTESYICIALRLCMFSFATLSHFLYRYLACKTSPLRSVSILGGIATSATAYRLLYPASGAGCGHSRCVYDSSLCTEAMGLHWLCNTPVRIKRDAFNWYRLIRAESLQCRRKFRDVIAPSHDKVPGLPQNALLS